ncbi:MAG: sulfotransferase family 2 domain-containing protein [Pseudomonadota bacterium]
MTTPAPFSLARTPRKPRQAAPAALAELEPAFGEPRWALEWLTYIAVAPSRAWAFKPSGKSGTSSALHFLHLLEFGVPVSASLAPDDALNPDQAPHSLMSARVFTDPVSAADLTGTDPLALLQSALRLALVRDPFDRALSGFRYLCLSDRRGLSHFIGTRLRLTARTRFDWTRHPDTADGFLRFLDYIEAEIEDGAGEVLNSHVRPQVLNIRPDLFRPDIVGRTEDLPAFYAKICTRLARPLPAGIDPARRHNAQGAPDPALAQNSAARTAAARIFAADYAAFGYTPEAAGPVPAPQERSA